MSASRETKRKGFYNELSENKQIQFFGKTRDKFIATIDNLYFNVHLAGDGESQTLQQVQYLLDELEALKNKAICANEPIEAYDGLTVTLKSYSFYRYCLTDNDLFDIFVCSALPNTNTPRISVQLRSFGLWTRGIDELLSLAYQKVEALLAVFGLVSLRYSENRIDYCYHTNAISSPDKAFREVNSKIKHLYTNLSHATTHSDLEHSADGTIFHKDYICFGQRKSNNVRARVYDKAKEVIEMGYKNFFFKLWHDNGLISYYDKWCMEYAFPYKNIGYLHKARLAFYVEHGSDPVRRQRYFDAINNSNSTFASLRVLADEFMPPVTAVVNIEYETKRKFYYYSDDFINSFDTFNRISYHAKLERIYKILDNRQIFLEYLTRETLSFYNGVDADGNPRYLAWWKRLRHVKLGCVKFDAVLLREYNYRMDKAAIQKRAINALASNAVYSDKLESGFVEDIADFLADITDNSAHSFRFSFVDLSNGEVLTDLQSSMLASYQFIKEKKDKHLKNRKSQAAKQQVTQQQVTQQQAGRHQPKNNYELSLPPSSQEVLPDAV